MALPEPEGLADVADSVDPVDPADPADVADHLVDSVGLADLGQLPRPVRL